VVQDTASALFGVAGLQVIDVEAGPGSVQCVWAATDHPDAAACPGCGTVATRVHEWVVTCPKDVRRGLDEVAVRWLKRRWKCEDPACGRRTFTESLPQVPPRCRVTGRLREMLGLLADRWHTCFYDLSGGQGLLGQVEGRTADDAAYWLAQAPPAWRGSVAIVAIDMCSIYLAAVRRMLPHAQVAVDLFHVVHLAVKTAADVRRRVVRGKYGRRGRVGDPEYGIKNLLLRNLEHLTPEQFAKIMDTLSRDRDGQEIAVAWIAKEKLRHALNLRARITGSTPCERDIRDRLTAFYDWCAQNDDIPELVSLATTISPLGRPDRLRRPDRRHQRHLRKPEPARETRSTAGIRVPQPRKPAQARPDRLHPRHPAQVTHRNHKQNTPGNQAETGSRLTSKAP
jgi:transposase